MRDCKTVHCVILKVFAMAVHSEFEEDIRVGVVLACSVVSLMIVFGDRMYGDGIAGVCILHLVIYLLFSVTQVVVSENTTVSVMCSTIALVSMSTGGMLGVLFPAICRSLACIYLLYVSLPSQLVIFSLLGVCLPDKVSSSILAVSFLFLSIPIEYHSLSFSLYASLPIPIPSNTVLWCLSIGIAVLSQYIVQWYIEKLPKDRRVESKRVEYMDTEGEGVSKRTSQYMPRASFNYIPVLTSTHKGINDTRDSQIGSLLDSLGVDIVPVFDELRLYFGFQKDSVLNQQEHLLFLLANIHLRPKDPSLGISRLHTQLFLNYRRWCTHLGVECELSRSSTTISHIREISLFLLIWGECSNLRHMPECICYLFHSCRGELELGQRMHRPEGDFLYSVVQPLYLCLGSSPNYDDLNEFFWDKSCLQTCYGFEFGFGQGLPRVSELLLLHGKTFVEVKSHLSWVRVFWRLLMLLGVMYGGLWLYAVVGVTWLMGVGLLHIWGILQILGAMVEVVVDTCSKTIATFMLHFISWLLVSIGSLFLFVPKEGEEAQRHVLLWVVCLPYILSLSIVYWQRDTHCYVGRSMDMHLDIVDRIPYVLFWGVLLLVKLVVSYKCEILPLIELVNTDGVIGMVGGGELGRMPVWWMAVLIVPSSILFLVDLVVWYSVGQFVLVILQGVISSEAEESNEGTTTRSSDTYFVKRMNSLIVTQWRERDLISDQEKNMALDTLSESVSCPLHKELRLQGKEAKRLYRSLVYSAPVTCATDTSVKDMPSMWTVTPFYAEDVFVSDREDIVHLQRVFPQEWSFLLERGGNAEEWASLRGQTLYRTLRGIQLYQRAVRERALLEGLDEEDALTLSMLKAGHVVGCQLYGNMNMSGKDTELENVMQKVDGVRMMFLDRERWSVVLAKWGKYRRGMEEVYRIILPGNPLLGEGKPENQNLSLTFVRGEVIQTIDMNQDNYLEEALQLGRVLQLMEDNDHVLMGFGEHCFTGQLSCVGRYMALQETTFVGLGQPLLSTPLKLRLHYGHPDLFRGSFVLSSGGLSKASKGVNLSEDIFGGFNVLLRGKSIGFSGKAQVGKGRDVGLGQVVKFESKLAQGAAQQSWSRDLLRLSRGIDIFRLCTLWVSTSGWYVSQWLGVCLLRIWLIIRVVGDRWGLSCWTVQRWEGWTVALGLLVPLWWVLSSSPRGKGRGWLWALLEVGWVVLSGGLLFYLHTLGTRAYYWSESVRGRGEGYKGTGRGLARKREGFVGLWEGYWDSHVGRGVELIVVGVVGGGRWGGVLYWAVVGAWIGAPFWFNPRGLSVEGVMSDWVEWVEWEGLKGGRGLGVWVGCILVLVRGWAVLGIGILYAMCVLVFSTEYGRRVKGYQLSRWSLGLLVFYWVYWRSIGMTTSAYGIVVWGSLCDVCGRGGYWQSVLSTAFHRVVGTLSLCLLTGIALLQFPGYLQYHLHQTYSL